LIEPSRFSALQPARWSKLLLLAAVGLFFTIVVFNNITDFDSNYQFVRHILSMDSTFPGNKGMWRAIASPLVHQVFYLSIIAWELLSAVLCWWGALALWRTLHAPVEAFERAKRIGIAALTTGMLMWLVAFECVGGEWFLMWQSKGWNGQEAAFRMFMIEAVLLVLLQLPEPAAGQGK
jgi:predicted small integral membrane protein